MQKGADATRKEADNSALQAGNVLAVLVEAVVVNAVHNQAGDGGDLVVGGLSELANVIDGDELAVAASAAGESSWVGAGHGYADQCGESEEA